RGLLDRLRGFGPFHGCGRGGSLRRGRSRLFLRRGPRLRLATSARLGSQLRRLQLLARGGERYLVIPVRPTREIDHFRVVRLPQEPRELREAELPFVEVTRDLEHLSLDVAV